MTDAKPTRRSFLTLLGLAPIAAPAALAAATAPRAAIVRFIGGSTPFLGTGSRILLADEVDTYAAITAQESTAELIEERLITWPEGLEKDRIRTEFAAFIKARKSPLGLMEWRPSMNVGCPVFVDDVGSGP